MSAKFEIGLEITKAYKDDAGQMHVLAVASDTGVDLHEDRFSKTALDGMVTRLRSGEVALLPSHHSAFEIGKLVLECCANFVNERCMPRDQHARTRRVFGLRDQVAGNELGVG